MLRRFSGLAILLCFGLNFFSLSSYAETTNASRPQGYTKICAYGDSCLLTKPNLVAFGSQDQYVYKVLSGSFSCTERTFNRPAIDSNSAVCSIKSTLPAKTKAPTKTQTYSKNLADGVYAIVSRHSGKALALTDDGELRQAPYKGNITQYFDIKKGSEGYYTVKVIGTNNLTHLAVKNWQTNDGAEIALDSQTTSWDQQWIISATELGYFSIVSRFNGKALDLLGLNTHNNAKLRLWTYWGGNNQQWQLIPITKNSTPAGVLEF